MTKLTKRQIQRNLKKKRREKQLQLYKSIILALVSTIIFFIVVVNVSTSVLESITSLSNYNKPDDKFTIIEANGCKFKMYTYAYPHYKFTTLLIDESLKDFEPKQLNFNVDEIYNIRSERELIDYYQQAKKNQTKLYIIIDPKHKKLISTMENLREFESIIDVKGKAEIYNCGNPNAQNVIIFVDRDLNIIPKNIAFWNLGIKAKEDNIINRPIDDSNFFSSYYSKNYTKSDNPLTFSDDFNIFIIVDKDNLELIDACKNLGID